MNVSKIRDNKVSRYGLTEMLNSKTVVDCPESRFIVGILVQAIADQADKQYQRNANYFIAGRGAARLAHLVGIDDFFLREVASKIVVTS